MTARRVVATYSYMDAASRERFERVRWEPKCFGYRWRKRPGWVYHWGTSNMPDGGWDRWKHLIYNLPAVLRQVEAGGDIYWCEGEKDADAITARGHVATSQHGGAGNVTLGQAQWFAKAAETGARVFLVYDLDPDDARGGNVGAADVCRRYELLRQIGVPRVQIGVLRPREGKDAFDHLAAEWRVDELISAAPEDLLVLRQKAGRTRSRSRRALGYRRGVA